MLKQILSCLQQIKSNPTFLKMAESLPVSLGKRPAETEKVDSGTEVHKKKKRKRQHVVQLGKSEGCKRKIAMLVAYNGAGYYGVQINPGFPTIESEIFPALVTVGAIPQDHADTPSKMWFQRGSRTDKGVSAVGQLLTLKAVLVPDLVKKLNEVLPPQIRVMGYVRTTNGFDSKNWCDSRTYMYMLPTFAFAPFTKFITDDYRTTPEIQTTVRAVLSKFVGTHKFHNFTSGVKYEQACASRYIIKFECSEPYIREGIEFVTLQVKGQSFMLHHIRKMIGLTIAILRGYCGESTIESSWGPEKVDIPKAPGLGLVLETLHVDAYNKKFGSDGVHERIDWSQYQETVEKFKEENVISYIVSQEKTERVMFNWLRTLQFHNFDQPRLEGTERTWVRDMLSGKSPEQKESLNSDAQPVTDVFENNERKYGDQVNVIENSGTEECSSNQGNLDFSNQDNLVSSNQDNLVSSNQDDIVSSNQENLVSSNQDDIESSNQENLVSSNQDNLVSLNQDKIVSSNQDKIVSSYQNNFDSSSQDNLVNSANTKTEAIIGSTTDGNCHHQLPMGDASGDHNISSASTTETLDGTRNVAQSLS